MIVVVIPNWNGAEFLAECLESLRGQVAHQTIVVDNGSTDDSAKIVERDFPEVELIKLPQNRGFAGGVNIGIKAAIDRSATFVALFNNDAVADEGWLEQLVVAAQFAKVGIVTSKIVSADGATIDSTGDFYSKWGLPFPRGRGEVDHGQYDRLEPVFSASGGSSLYSTEMLNEIGLFDEAFFAYYEDVDISFRARLAGWSVLYQPKSRAFHRIGATSGKVSGFARYHSVKNLPLLYTKNLPGWLYWKYLPFFVATMALVGLNSLHQGNFWPYLKGLGGGLIRLPQAIMKRFQIQSSRKVSSRQIDRLLYHQLPPIQQQTIRSLFKRANA